jgi:4-aminobutyrate aminotransferase
VAQTLEERERRVIAEIQKIRFFPLSVIGGEGSYLVDESGQRILDLSGTWGRPRSATITPRWRRRSPG